LVRVIRSLDLRLQRWRSEMCTEMCTDMEQYIGLLKVGVVKGTNLVATDLLSSTTDPYVAVSLGNQKVKTRTVKRNLNPVWDDELTVGVPFPPGQLIVEVMDKDTFSKDEFLGGAKVNLEPFVTVARKYHAETTNNNKRDRKKTKEIGMVLASQHSELVKDSPIFCRGGKVQQNLHLKLDDARSGEIEIEFTWVHIN